MFGVLEISIYETVLYSRMREKENYFCQQIYKNCIMYLRKIPPFPSLMDVLIYFLSCLMILWYGKLVALHMKNVRIKKCIHLVSYHLFH